MDVFKIDITEKSILNLIIANRPFIMGVAMTMVIVYHLFCWVYNPIGPFNIGYVGVDIFLFLSGLGLSYSFEKNSITQYYKNRIKRIYPIYFLSVISTYLIYKLNWSIFVLLENLLTISFYTKGGINRYDWYLESLFSLYILFPIIYYWGRFKMAGVVILLIVITFILLNFNIPWWYDCILGRLPIFLYGVIFKHCTKSYKTISIIGILFYLPCYKYVSTFLASSGLTIPLIISTLVLVHFSPTRIKESLSYIGKHSLEFYIANLFVFWLFEGAHYTTIKRFILFVIIQLISTVILVKLNEFIHSGKLNCLRNDHFGLP